MRLGTMAMAERWNRIMLRTLRALRDLRRYSQPVLIQNAGQVNVSADLHRADGGAPADE
jgi:hypothetical protein